MRSVLWMFIMCILVVWWNLCEELMFSWVFVGCCLDDLCVVVIYYFVLGGVDYCGECCCVVVIVGC